MAGKVIYDETTGTLVNEDGTPYSTEINPFTGDDAAEVTADVIKAENGDEDARKKLADSTAAGPRGTGMSQAHDTNQEELNKRQSELAAAVKPYNAQSEYDNAKNATVDPTPDKGFYEYGIDPETARRIQEDLQKNQNSVKDYFKDSMTDTWKNLGEGDKKLLILDQIGTTLRNLSKARLPMYSAYGKNYEGQGVGNEKSQLQKTLESSLQAGLQRRNDRLNSAMEEQIKVANFPAEQQMKFRDYWKSLQFNNDAKIDLINKLANVKYRTALSAWMTQNPHAPIEDAFRAVDQIISGTAAIRGGGRGGSTAGSSAPSTRLK